jgi:glucosamine-6-phosphate deaminase
MRIIQCESTQEAVDTVAEMLMNRIESHPTSVVGLATGRTMEPVYAAMKKKLSSGINLQKCFFFMLDEYMGLPENHPSSFKHYIKTHVILPMGLNESQFAFPPVHAQDGGAHYEQSLKEAGGVDLQLLGIGQNGHVGFNEPGSLKDSRTRIVHLTEETINANKDQFVDQKIPSEALSMGIGTILESKSLVMLATGKSKADAIKYLQNHHDDPSCPATYLKNHPHFTLVLDPDAASKINLKI